MIKPLCNQILVLEIQEEQTVDGIYLPETSKADVKFGKIVAVGKDVTLEKGSTIGFGLYAGIACVIEGVEFLLMKEGEALFEVVSEEG